MNLFFDVDHTIVDGDDALRPGVREAFTSLRAAGHTIYLWSGLGPRWEIVRRHALEDLVQGCFDKPLYRHREMLTPLGIPVRPDFVVDDHRDPVDLFGGIVVSAYRQPSATDREMHRVVEAVRRHADVTEPPLPDGDAVSSRSPTTR
ncbi:MAG: hypothetical protein DWQ36_11695 [Acidobacteria bacterium]|nr:MAG: hypothetical protein DWQ30_17995 [Acidobacteriota bacterium]REK07642.1 MAG: hypothetical protein DWQ36_11695 [Acidobacteriota bacterium]